MGIHPTALVDPAARIHSNAEIGPYCIIGAEVEIGARTRLMAHVYMEGPTWLGEDNLVYPYATIGVASQDLKYKGERAETRIGSGNTIRESVTIHRGTQGGGALTSIGDGNLLMTLVHVAHDVHIGSHCVLANAVTFAGHVSTGDSVTIGAYTGLHQFCRIGRHAMIGGYSVITQDVLPFSQTTGGGRDVKLYDVNRIGLERRGFSREAIDAVHRFIRLLRSPKHNTSQAIAEAEAGEVSAEVSEVIEFIRTSQRGFVK
jgi:UDP-N-acetylglucosamine acyltransferase